MAEAKAIAVIASMATVTGFIRPWSGSSDNGNKSLLKDQGALTQAAVVGHRLSAPLAREFYTGRYKPKCCPSRDLLRALALEGAICNNLQLFPCVLLL